jgi:hypothetical protein
MARYSVRLLLLLCIFVVTAQPLRAESPDQFLIPSRFFEATGHNVGGPFLAFYEANGGVDMFGLPLTEVLTEDGMQVQYFERVRFEIRPTLPERVWISALGEEIAAARASEPPFVRHKPVRDEASTYFPATGHNLSYQFRDFWEQQGGYPIFGYPISEAFVERNPENGLVYTVQYFERARLEYRLDYPGSLPQVQVGLLGRQYLAQHSDVPAQALEPARPLELLGTSTVHFGTDDGDMQNVRLASRQFDGLKVMPDEELSFLETVGELSEDTGYVKGYGIVNGSIGRVIAGGICYVSTALFQAIIPAGLEIIERHPHSLALNGFGTLGLDSAVYTPDQMYMSKYDVDLRWRNDLPDPILIVTDVITSGDLTISIWGYNDGRKTIIRDAIVDNTTNPATAVWRYDETMTTCEVQKIATGNPGKNVSVERIVWGADDTVLHKDYFASRYAPLRDVFVYGPGVTPLRSEVVGSPAQAAREQCLAAQRNGSSSP